MFEIDPLIYDLTVVLIAAAIVTVVFKWLKQPLILGYIVAGIIAGPAITFLPTVEISHIQTWADIGVIFLLFAMGLDFSFKKLMKVGFSAIVAAVIIVCSMMFLGYTAGQAMNFSQTSSIFLGGMLSMSSTTIVFKAFGDMGLTKQKFTNVVLGILVVEDLVAVVLLVVLSTLAVGQHVEGSAMIMSVVKLVTFLIFWFALGIYLLPTLLKKIRRFISNETLLIIALGLCFGMVVIACKSGFSSALGAFVMGSLLAETIEAENIVKVVQPVKDLFGAVFFVSVGMMISPMVVWHNMAAVVILTLLVVCGQVLFGTLGVLVSGQPLKIAIRSGFSLTQIGEFSFIIASLGMSLRVINAELYPIIVAVSVITTFLTPYMIGWSEPVYRFVNGHLPPLVKQYLKRYTAATPVKHRPGPWQRLIKSIVLLVGVFLTICVVYITLHFTYFHPYIQEHLPGLKGNLLSFVILFVPISPLLWAIIMKKNHSPEFKQLWAENKLNRAPLIALVIARVVLCVNIVMGLIIYLFDVAIGVGLLLSVLIIGSVYFSKWVRKRFLNMEEQFLTNLQGSGEEGGKGEQA